MEKKYIEASELPLDEKVYLRKDFLGWKIIHPVKVDGKFNWANFLVGGKRNGFWLLLILLFLGLAYVGINDLISSYKEVADNPCAFCEDCHQQCRIVQGDGGYKAPEFDFTFDSGGDNG